MTVNLLDKLVENRVLPDGYDSWGIKSVRPDLRTREGFRWPFPGGETERYELDDHDGSCPRRAGDGLCVATTWAGMASGGYPARTLLLVAYRSSERQGDEPGKLRVPQCFVVDVIDGETLLRQAGAGADLAGANLTGADLRRADLTGADLTGANLTGAYLRRAYLTDAYLTDANLTGANLTGADLAGADLTGADLTGADLTGADLRRADLRRADLRRAYLTDANLTDADLRRADLRRAYLTGADLTGQNLENLKSRGALL